MMVLVLVVIIDDDDDDDDDDDNGIKTNYATVSRFVNSGLKKLGINEEKLLVLYSEAVSYDYMVHKFSVSPSAALSCQRADAEDLLRVLLGQAGDRSPWYSRDGKVLASLHLLLVVASYISVDWDVLTADLSAYDMAFEVVLAIIAAVALCVNILLLIGVGKLEKTSEKTQPGNQPMRESNPRPSATPDGQASTLDA
ncbi:hypothetical protein ANN_02836 [Periplaneta americana]|uniref:Uncharacterized protein n=1 Tax=Periplaneta americana TaxID=6978 RepID=A0ABQ8TXF0_PERAM|nr:hypothetical protein ANN_02836 [Periplaneta americana]